MTILSNFLTKKIYNKLDVFNIIILSSSLFFLITLILASIYGFQIISKDCGCTCDDNNNKKAGKCATQVFEGFSIVLLSIIIILLILQYFDV